MNTLTEKQQKALIYCKKKAKIISKNMKLLTLAKFQKLGYDENDMNNVVDIMKNKSLLIIHFRSNNIIDFLLKDGLYKNLFEIGRG